MVSTAAGHRRIIQHHLDCDQDLGDPDRPQMDWSRLMDDTKLLISLGSTLASLAGAFAVVRYQVGSILTTLIDVEKRLRAMDTRIDKAELTDQRVSILAGMLSPAERDKSARETAKILAEIERLRIDVDHQMSIHNGRHPDIK